MNANQTLELNKVLSLLAKETATDDAAEAALALEPSPYAGEVQTLLRETGDAVALASAYGAPSFGRLKSPKNALARASAGAALSLTELLGVGELLRVIRSLSEWRSRAGENPTSLDDRFGALTPNRYLERRIEETVLSDEEVADTASPELADIRRGMRRASAKVREQLDRLIRSSTAQKALQEPIVTIRSGRFVVPVKTEHKAEIPGLVHDTSASGATVFVEPMGAVEANNELKVLKAREEAEIERILLALSHEIGGFAQELSREYGLLVQLDLIFAKASLAISMKAEMPDISENGALRLVAARHPLIDPHTVVPIDVTLGESYDTLVITGPNTGGKTVTLKTIGLLTLMTACGLMPPCAEGSRFPVFEQVLADIGDEQSIEQSLSTFSAHMTHIAQILRVADEHTLVLLDELGSGTDPVEGAALATAVLEALRAKGAKIAATTHYAELKAYAIATDGVENGSCEFDVQTLRPTYRLLVGVPGRSNAFAISRALGLPEEVLQRAGALVSRDDRRMEQVVVTIDERRRELEQSLEEAQASRDEAKRAEKDAERRLAEMEKAREKLLQDAENEARAITERARAQASTLQNELERLRRQSKEGDHAADSARRELRARLDALDAAASPVRAEEPIVPAPSAPIAVGDDVRILSIDKTATVLSLSQDGKQAEVLAGIIRTRVPVSDLRRVENPKKPAGGVRQKTASRAERSAETEVDLRGMASDEAVLTLDRFIDNAVMAGLSQIRIIHGKGTGVLRSTVSQHLRRHPSVKSFRLGTYGEGENGVTIAELRE